jgi:GTPase SAR1 family protein
MYSITDQDTFAEVTKIRNQILMVRGLPEVKAPPIVLVGNKADLEDKREVSHQEGKDLAHQWNCPFFETSAKLKTNIEETFFCLVRKIREAEGLPQNKYGDKPSKSCLLF